jgi:urease accessory protein
LVRLLLRLFGPPHAKVGRGETIAEALARRVSNQPGSTCQMMHDATPPPRPLIEVPAAVGNRLEARSGLVPGLGLERSFGRVELAFKRRGASTVLAHLYQAGCGKARLPRPVLADHAEAVLINLAGGLTGGDRLDWRVTWREDAAATVSGQAAEKIYRARASSTAMIEATLTVEPGAVGLWLPQETILFDRARLERRNRFDVARGGRLLAVEATVMGRRAMGETVLAGLFDERFEVRYDGRLLLAERQRFRGRIAELLARPAVAGGATALASLIHVGEAAADRLGAVREALAGLPAAATAPDRDILLVRWLAATPAGLRNHLAAALLVLQSALGLPRQLPRVWSC